MCWYEWRSPADSPVKIVRNQIGFLFINRRHRNCIKSAKTYPGADIGSDHNLKVRLKKIQQPTKTTRVDLDKLKNPESNTQLRLGINDKMCRLKHENDNPVFSHTKQAW